MPALQEHAVLKRHFLDILNLLRDEPKSFLELRKELHRPPPDTLNRRLRELRQFRLIEPFVHREGERSWRKYRLTAKGQKMLPELAEFVSLAKKIESRLRE